MWGKCWITIIRNHSFHKSLHLIGMFHFIMDCKRAVTVTSSVFCSIKHVFIPISSDSKNSLKRTQRTACGIVATLASSEQGVQSITVIQLINVLHRFFGAERSPGLFPSNRDGFFFVKESAALNDSESNNYSIFLPYWMNDVTPRSLRRWLTATYWSF